MRFWSLLIISVFITIQISVLAQERKFQIWNANGVAVKLAENLSLEAKQEIHYTTTESSMDLTYGDFWVKHQLNNWIKFGGGFRLVSFKKTEGNLEEQRPMFLLTLSKELDKFDFDFSNRMEYRNFKMADNHFRYKQSVNINFPSLTPLNLKFYAREESFLKFTEDKTHLARLYAGVKAFNSEKVNVKVYYALEKRKQLELWNTIDILGMNMNIYL